MSEKVEIQIVGDESAAQAAFRRAAQAVSDASATMKSRLADIQSASRSSFGAISTESKQAGASVEQETGRMGGALDGLRSRFSAFAENFKRGWREADEEIKRTARSAEQARESMGRPSSGGGGESKGGGMLGGAMAVFKGGLMLEAASKLKDIAVATVETSAEFERLRGVLLTLEGSVGAANNKFGELKKFGQETPYELTEVVTAFSKLKAQGLDPSNAAMKSYGNTASAMGKSLDQMVEAVADASMGEYERLKEFGIKASDAGDKVVFNFKGQATEVAKNSADIQAYLQNIGNTEFAGAMERQMDTLGGKFSNLTDTAANFADEIGQGGLSQALKDAMDTMTSATGSSTELAHGLGEILGQAVRGVMEIVQTMRGIFADTFGLIKQIVADTMGKSAGDALTFGNIMKFVASLVSAAADVIQWAIQIISTAVQFGINAWTTWGEVIDRVLHLDFSGMIQAVEDGVTRQVNIFQNGWNRMVDINQKGQDRLKQINGDGKSDKADTSYAAGYVAEHNANVAKPKPPTVGGAGGGHSKKTNSNAKSEADRLKREAEQAAREVIRVKTDEIRATEQLETDGAQHSIDLSRINLQAQLDDIDERRQAGQISAAQQVAEKNKVNQQLRNLDMLLEEDLSAARLKSLKDQIKLYKSGQDEYRKLNIAIEREKRLHDQRMERLDRQAKNAERREQSSLQQARTASFQKLSQSFGDNIARMVTFQQGFGATVKGIWGSIVGMITQALGEILAQFIMKHIMMALFGKTMGAVGIKADAGRAAAAAWASTAAIPIVGPALAPAAGAAAGAGALALGLSFAAKDGYDVPALAGPGIDGKGGQMGVVHPREMILPADLADNIRNGGMGGNMTFNVQAMDARSFKRFAMDNKGELANALRKYARDGGR